MYAKAMKRKCGHTSRIGADVASRAWADLPIPLRTLTGTASHCRSVVKEGTKCPTLTYGEPSPQNAK